MLIPNLFSVLRWNIIEVDIPETTYYPFKFKRQSFDVIHSQLTELEPVCQIYLRNTWIFP